VTFGNPVSRQFPKLMSSSSSNPIEGTDTLQYRGQSAPLSDIFMDSIATYRPLYSPISQRGKQAKTYLSSSASGKECLRGSATSAGTRPVLKHLLSCAATRGNAIESFSGLAPAMFAGIAPGWDDTYKSPITLMQD